MVRKTPDFSGDIPQAAFQEMQTLFEQLLMFTA